MSSRGLTTGPRSYIFLVIPWLFASPRSFLQLFYKAFYILSSRGLTTGPRSYIFLVIPWLFASPANFTTVFQNVLHFVIPWLDHGTQVIHLPCHSVAFCVPPQFFTTVLQNVLHFVIPWLDHGTQVMRAKRTNNKDFITRIPGATPGMTAKFREATNIHKKKSPKRGIGYSVDIFFTQSLYSSGEVLVQHCSWTSFFAVLLFLLPYIKSIFEYPTAVLQSPVFVSKYCPD